MILTANDIVEELVYWEDIVRAQVKLPALDIAHIWCAPNDEISQYTLVFRTSGDNSHRNTQWFNIDPIACRAVQYHHQHQSFKAVTPAAGVAYMLWKRNGLWFTMARTPYAFDIYQRAGQFINRKEQLS